MGALINNLQKQERSRFTPKTQDDPCDCTSIPESLIFGDSLPVNSPTSCDCNDCGVDTQGELTHEIYMVTEEVWGRSGLCGCKTLCIGCLERRIGRLLDSADFTTCPVNFENVIGMRPVTPRLLHRLFTPHGQRNVFHDWVAAMYDDFYFGDMEFGESEMASFNCDVMDHPYPREFGAVLRMFGQEPKVL